MAYNTNKLLRDVDGHPIPQYYNPTTDKFEAIQGSNGGNLSQLSGSYVRLSTEPKPTEADGVKDGNDLLLVDTKQVYIFYKGQWYLQ